MKMNFFTVLLVYIFVVLFHCASSERYQQPNIVFIVADDLGWNDVSFHGSNQIMTPNLDVLAYEGVILNQYYTDTQGTASISALLTGKYPMRLGTQGISITACEDRGIPVSEKLLPSLLQELGYSTHLIGKWNAGKSREHYLPTYRGFDTFYGFLDSSVDYYTYNLIETCNSSVFFGLNMFNNLEPIEDQNGHLTEILTDQAVQIIREHNTSTPLYIHISHAAPHSGGGLVNLQPPVDTIEANAHILHSARRLYAGLVTGLDRSVGNVVAALAEKDILQNTIIIFVSDNGAAPLGPSQNFGSNLPFRGAKGTPWEGAMRSTGILWYSPLAPKIHDGLFHVTDWLPTLVAAANGGIPEGIDGINQWNTINNDESSKRNDAVLTIDDLNGWAAFRDGHFKIVVGNVDNNISSAFGKELIVTKNEIPLYENLLIECETNRVLKETLDFVLDIDLAFAKRSDLTFTEINNSNSDLCVPTKTKGCLFNITADPLEANDLWNALPDVVRQMTLRLRTLWMEGKPRREPESDLRADPSLQNYVWYPWLQNADIEPESPKSMRPFPLQVSAEELQYLVDLNFNMFKDKLNLYIQNMGDSFVKSVRGLFSF